MNIFSLFATLKLDKSDYEKGIKDAKKEGESFADDTEKKISPKAVSSFLAIATAVVAVTKQIYNLAKASMDYADNIGNMASKYGLTTDAISEMQYIADQSSTSIEGMTSAMTMLLNRAKENGDGFKELGVDVYDANGNLKQMDELFYEIIGALNNVESEGERSRLMLETFGRSAMSVGEVVRKSSEELAQMRQEAHDLGIVLNEETINYASDFNDTLAVLKLQGQSALASLVAGDKDAEEKLQNFFDNVMDMLDDYLPASVNFGIRLLTEVIITMVRIAPSLAVEVIDAFIDTIFTINWFQVGIDVGKSILEGIINILGSALGVLGINVPKVDLGVGENVFEPTASLGSEYEISENIKQDITVKVEASGDTTVSQATAEETAKALAPYIDKILGGK